MRGAAILTAGVFLVKLLGALFKIPLNWIIQEDGMGYFTTAYSFYSPIYSLATAGFPIAISRMVSAGIARGRFREVRQVHRVSVFLFLLTGLLGTALMLLGAGWYVEAVGNPGALPAMVLLAPSILFSCLSAIYRGYYEGLRNMTPTAVSQILEALCRLGLGLFGSFWVLQTAQEEAAPAQPDIQPSGTVEGILAPLPMQPGEGSAAAEVLDFGPARQSPGAYTVRAYDSSVIRQPATGQVDLSYFADAAFLGDSLTVGFTDYDINLGGALVCGYIGAGPDTIVNRMTVSHMTRGDEVALDVLAAAQPKKLYILLGTNTLTTAGAEERFLTYYGAMLDALREALGPDCVIYVQSIPPVRPEAAAERPGLTSDNLRRVNEQLAQLAET